MHHKTVSFIKNTNNNKRHTNIKKQAINKHPETLMQSFSPSSVIAYSWSYTLPNFAQRHSQKCAVKNLRGIVLMDGVAVIHQSFSTTVLPSSFRQQVCSKNEHTVYSVCVFGLTVCCWKEVGGSQTERHKYGSWSSVLHRKETAGMKWKSQGTDLLSPLSSPFLPPYPPFLPHSFSHQSVEVTSQHRGGDGVDGVTICCHALEGQRGCNVTAVGR